MTASALNAGLCAFVYHSLVAALIANGAAEPKAYTIEAQGGDPSQKPPALPGLLDGA
jgi:hypothetical protein